MMGQARYAALRGVGQHFQACVRRGLGVVGAHKRQAARQVRSACLLGGEGGERWRWDSGVVQRPGLVYEQKGVKGLPSRANLIAPYVTLFACKTAIPASRVMPSFPGLLGPGYLDHGVCLLFQVGRTGISLEHRSYVEPY